MKKMISRRNFLKAAALAGSAMALSAAAARALPATKRLRPSWWTAPSSSRWPRLSTLTGTTSYPAGSESEPNNRTIFKRLEESTNVHIEWTAIQSDQWGDKISLNMSNPNTLTDFVFTADFSDSNLLPLRQAGGGSSPWRSISTPVCPTCRPSLKSTPSTAPCAPTPRATSGPCPGSSSWGVDKTAIQTVGNMPFINTKWLNFLGLEMPHTVDEFEQVLTAFRDNAASIQSEFGIEGSIIPMSCIVNDGDQDPAVLINGFGEGYGDMDKGRHIAVTNDRKVICAAAQEGYRDGIQWLHKLYTENLIDPECFTQEWSTYVSKGKAGRYGVCFSWDVANIDNLNDWEPLPRWPPTPPISPRRTVPSPVASTAAAVWSLPRQPSRPGLPPGWDQMYIPIQSAQNNWGTYGEDDGFDIFEMSTNADGEPMLKHAPLGDASPVEVREAESVNGPLAILNDYYDVYVTCPDDAQYRLDWIEQIYTPEMHNDYVFPNVFMSNEDTDTISELETTCPPT